VKNHQPVVFYLDTQPGNGAPARPFVTVTGVPEGIDFIVCENDGGRPLLFSANGGSGSPVLIETGSIVGLARGATRFSVGCAVGDEHDTLGLAVTSKPRFIGLTSEAAMVYAPNAPKKVARRLLPIQMNCVTGVEHALYTRVDGTFMLTLKNPTASRMWIANVLGEAAKNDAGGALNFPLEPGEAYDVRGPMFAYQASGANLLLSVYEHNIPVL
jgi:hypothetical protein